jgi:hypothetical protein
MTDQPKVRLEEWHPDWRGWIKGILREVDRAERHRIWLTHNTLRDADYLEEQTWRLNSRQEWPDCLLGHLQNLKTSLDAEEDPIIQRALELTQDLIVEITKTLENQGSGQ